ncbi:sulfur carrier protein ThiS [Cetobacterium sp. SF1]|uniref:sulfur carrier protein ThiS n=1 Tax=Cetobacterium sp. SF1 TaxID=3417654 RepID=UPI003CF154CE
MKFYLNGEEKDFNKKLSLYELFISLNLNLEGTVILLNDNIISQDDFHLSLKENDKVEVLRFVSGG